MMERTLLLSDSQTPLDRPQERPHDQVSEEVLIDKRVVIAEDEGIICMQLDRLLKRAGLQVVGKAGNGQQAVEIVLRERPDIVLMDIRMPLMDGMQAAERILQEYRPCIMFVTAFTHFQEQARQIDACGYLVKPVTSENLLPALREAYAFWQQRA
ncbi:MAG TPA: response regulator [Chthonomonadaceae bacterium]|nr:response regulator [Chthonomonadaceae bacterium]